MRTVCSVARRFRKIGFMRITSMTRPLPVRVPAVQYDGEEARSWFEDEDKWLNSNATDPMGTEPFVPLSKIEEIQYRRCNCALAVDWCWCKQ